MLSKIFFVLIVQLFLSSEQTQIPKIYEYYVYNKTFVDPVEGPSKCGCGPEQTILLILKKNFSFILSDNYKTENSSSTSEMTGNWHLNSENALQLNVQLTEKTSSLRNNSIDITGNKIKPTTEHFGSPKTLTLEFSQSGLIYGYDKELIPSGELIKMNKKRMQKIYGDK